MKRRSVYKTILRLSSTSVCVHRVLAYVGRHTTPRDVLLEPGEFPRSKQIQKATKYQQRRFYWPGNKEVGEENNLVGTC